MMRNDRRRFSFGAFITAACFLLWTSGCTSAEDLPTSTPEPPPTSTVAPPQTPGVPDDQRYTLTNDGRLYTAIPSVESGPIAVQVTLPAQYRYPEGAGVVVEVPPFFTPVEGYQQSLEVFSIGLIHVTFLWPGCTDQKMGHLSGGSRDYGGPGSIAALRDVIRFASGEIGDTNGRTISEIAGMPVMEGNVGLYAFSHPGLSAVSVMAAYGNQLPALRYFVGRENPTVDVISAMEIGHYDDDREPVINPLYRYPSSFRDDDIILDYSTLRWDTELPACGQGSTGAPYFDRDGNGRRDPTDHALGTQCPTMFGKRVYSAALTAALEANGVFAAGEWPMDLATPDEAENWWSVRESPVAYPALVNQIPGLKVLLVFAEKDHVQVLRDKPHIHQAWVGFAESAGLWVRLNPDSAYIECLGLDIGDWQDHPAGSAPVNWLDAYRWGYPSSGDSASIAALAGVAEMADRVYYENWAPDFDKVLGGVCKRS
jgi:hypothetical protein